jgi:hypothetical protein
MNIENRKELSVELSRIQYDITRLINRLPPQERQIEASVTQFVRDTENELFREKEEITNKKRINLSGLRYEERYNNYK